MSRHEGVSCDSCLKGNFHGKRYKCLLCYDYDLCAVCYEAGASTTRHNADHPMQCILTRSDFDLYYGGETSSVEHPQSFTCPFCGRMGLTEAALIEHVSAEHSDSSAEIVCPVCASQPGGEPNHLTDDFSGHLALDHRNRDLDEPSSTRHVRRVPHTGRGMSSSRPRRSQMQFTSGGALASISPNSRESMDPIAELLSQLSSVRRSNLAQANTTAQLQQLQMQLQMERQQAQMARQQLERMPRRQAGTVAAGNAAAAGAAAGVGAGSLQTHFTVSLEGGAGVAASGSSQFLLSRCTDPVITESEQHALDTEHAERSLFVQELLLNTLGEQLDAEDLESLETSLRSTAAEPQRAPATTPQSATAPQREAEAAPRESNPSTEMRQPPTGASTPEVQQRPSNPRIHGRGASNSYCNPRVAINSANRQLPRTTNRGTSPTRRKTLRQVDDRNKTTEPPPPH